MSRVREHGVHVSGSVSLREVEETSGVRQRLSHRDHIGFVAVRNKRRGSLIVKALAYWPVDVDLAFLDEPERSGGRERLRVAREAKRRVGAQRRARVVARDEGLVDAGARRHDVHDDALERGVLAHDLVDRRLHRGGAGLRWGGRRCCDRVGRRRSCLGVVGTRGDEHEARGNEENPDGWDHAGTSAAGNGAGAIMSPRNHRSQH